MKKSVLLLLFASILYADSSYYERGELITLQKMKTSRDANNQDIYDYYIDKNGNKIGVAKEILVKCKMGVDCKSFLSQYDFSSISNLTSTIFIVKTKTTDDAFYMSKVLFESNFVEFAQPNFAKERKLR